MASITSYFWRKVLKSTADWSLPFDQLRTRIDSTASWIKPPSDVSITAVNAQGVRGEWLTPRGYSRSHCMLYLHGGGYAMGSGASHRPLVGHITRATRVRSLLLDYRLAPEHRCPAALDDAIKAYRWLLEQGLKPERIVVAGDSAGGGLAIALLVALRDAHVPLPGLACCLSPWVDMTASGDSVQSNAAIDPWVTRKSLDIVRHYAGQLPLSSPMVSPLFSDLHGLPPLLIHVGSDEILLSDSARLAQKARLAGVPVTYREWPGMWHVFHAFAPYMPEANEAIREIGRHVSAWAAASGRRAPAAGNLPRRRRAGSPFSACPAVLPCPWRHARGAVDGRGPVR